MVFPVITTDILMFYYDQHVLKFLGFNNKKIYHHDCKICTDSFITARLRKNVSIEIDDFSPQCSINPAWHLSRPLQFLFNLFLSKSVTMFWQGYLIQHSTNFHKLWVVIVFDLSHSLWFSRLICKSTVLWLIFTPKKSRMVKSGEIVGWLPNRNTS